MASGDDANSDEIDVSKLIQAHQVFLSFDALSDSSCDACLFQVLIACSELFLVFCLLDEYDSSPWYDIVHFEHKLSWLCFGLPQKASHQWR